MDKIIKERTSPHSQPLHSCSRTTTLGYSNFVNTNLYKFKVEALLDDAIFMIKLKDVQNLTLSISFSSKCAQPETITL